MRVGWAVLVLGLFLAAAVPVQAAPGTIAVRAELPLEVSGTHAASGTQANFLLEGPDGTAAVLLQADSGEATRVIHRMWGYVNMQDPKLGLVWDDRVQFEPLSLNGGIISLDERRAEFSFLAYDGELALASGPQRGPLLVGALDSPKTVDHILDRQILLHLNPPSDEGNFQKVLGAGTLQARANDGRVTSDGPVSLFLTDAVVSYLGPSGPATVLAHFREEPSAGTIYNPVSGEWTGPGEHTEYVQEYLLVEATGHLEVVYAGVPASLYSQESFLTIDGAADLPAATGTVTVTEDGKATRHELRGDDLALAGRFTLKAHDVVSTPARAQVDGEGDLTAVTYAGVAATYDWTKAAAAAGLGALLLAIAGWLAFHAKTVGPAVGSLVAGYARVSGQEILEHPGRQEVYERVKAYPGVSFVQLADQVSFGQSTLNYHLRVLEKNEYITAVKDGRYLRFFDRQAGTYAGHRKLAVSALRNTTTAAMARHIKANPGVVQRDLAAAFGVTASTVNWHITRLAGAGLVTRTRDAHFTRYYLAEGWSQLPADEMERQDTKLAVPVAAPMVLA
ncbi:MAG: winged helix-turn-helix transcriptional regulator [Candidatus Thermoplasmatota archaeon]